MTTMTTTSTNYHDDNQQHHDQRHHDNRHGNHRDNLHYDNQHHDQSNGHHHNQRYDDQHHDQHHDGNRHDDHHDYQHYDNQHHDQRHDHDGHLGPVSRLDALGALAPGERLDLCEERRLAPEEVLANAQAVASSLRDLAVQRMCLIASSSPHTVVSHDARCSLHA